MIANLRAGVLYFEPFFFMYELKVIVNTSY